jgi:hypothetical protein
VLVAVSIVVVNVTVVLLIEADVDNTVEAALLPVPVLLESVTDVLTNRAAGSWRKRA